MGGVKGHMHMTWANSFKFGVYVPCMKGRKAIAFDLNWLTPGGVMGGQRSYPYNMGDFAQIWYIGALHEGEEDY